MDLGEPEARKKGPQISCNPDDGKLQMLVLLPRQCDLLRLILRCTRAYFSQSHRQQQQLQLRFIEQITAKCCNHLLTSTATGIVANSQCRSSTTKSLLRLPQHILVAAITSTSIEVLDLVSDSNSCEDCTQTVAATSNIVCLVVWSDSWPGGTTLIGLVAGKLTHRSESLKGKAEKLVQPSRG
ncbi:unnamed protein product [Ceratitis capitata]|uniref:(Mediterranean fruit fly) hypothetical protein n=1 Tax=Ceratitis capitata TaxID=7213 RepID=A0A811V2N1_CERCA|nr:unnamed protein product [Ceratitis capitata]